MCAYIFWNRQEFAKIVLSNALNQKPNNHLKTKYNYFGNADCKSVVWFVTGGNVFEGINYIHV